MPFKAKFKQDFYLAKDNVFLTELYKNKNSNRFKKITGSRFSAILNQNKYTTPFKIWAIMTNIYFEEMDPTLSLVGNTIEPKILKYVENELDVKFMQYQPNKINWDVFQDNKIFGGIPDGEPININKNFLYSNGYPMLEIKTTSIDSFVYKRKNNVLTMEKDKSNCPIVKQKNGKLSTWFLNEKIDISIDYKLQLGLYLYLRKINLGLFAIAFLKPNDYCVPEKFIGNDDNIETALMYVDQNEFKKLIDYAEWWYNKYIVSGISPKLTQEDLNWFKSEMNI